MKTYREDITKEVVDEINKTMSHKEIAKFFGVSTETIGRTARGERTQSNRSKKRENKICECCKISKIHPGFRKLCYACFTGQKLTNFDHDFLECT